MKRSETDKITIEELYDNVRLLDKEIWVERGGVLGYNMRNKL